MPWAIQNVYGDWWSIALGWVEIYAWADLFDDQDRDDYTLPTGGRWVASHD